MKLTKVQKIIILAVVAALLIAVAVICIINGTQPGGLPVNTKPSTTQDVATEPSTGTQGEVVPPVSGGEETTADEEDVPSDPVAATDETTGSTGPNNPTKPTEPGKPTDPVKPTNPNNPTKPTNSNNPTEPTEPEGSVDVGIWDETTEPIGGQEGDGTEPTTKPTDTTKPTTKPTDPTKPTTKPTDPTKPTTKPTDPTKPTTKPTDPTNPSGPVGNLGVGFWDEVTEPTGGQEGGGTEPTTKPTDPTKPTTKPTDPTKPTTKPTDPTQPTTKPTDPTQPTTKPTDPTQPTTQPTEPQPSETTKPTEPEKQTLTYAEYEALSPAEQQAYMETVFDGDVKAFFQWYKAAKAEHEANTEPVPTYNGGEIDLGDLVGKN